MEHSSLQYEAINDLLQRRGVGASAAECHGSLCGLLCAIEHLNSTQWAGQVLAGSLGPLADDESISTGADIMDGRELLVALFQESNDQLDHPDFGFTLLLPDDDEPLTERIEALSQWCQGFLVGLGLAGLQDQGTLSEDGAEVLRDFSEISRMGPGDVLEDNDEETAFAEIVEYVRMAVLLVYEELRPLRAGKPDSTAIH